MLLELVKHNGISTPQVVAVSTAYSDLFDYCENMLGGKVYDIESMGDDYAIDGDCYVIQPSDIVLVREISKKI